MWLFKRRAAASADDAPAAKRARHSGSSSASGTGGGSPEENLKGCQELHDTQLELQLLDERCAEEQISIQQRYDQLRRPHFDARGTLLRRFPGFWKAALCGHPFGLVAPFEVEALEHVVELDLRENTDRRGSYELRVHLGENTLFRERSVVKKVTFHDTLTERVEAAALTAASAKGREILDKAAAASAGRSVLGWLTSSKGTPPLPPTGGVAQVAPDFSEVLRRDLWQDPVPYFLAYHDAAKASVPAPVAASSGATQSATRAGSSQHSLPS